MFGLPILKASLMKDNDDKDTESEEDIQEFEFLKKPPWTDIQLEVDNKPLYVARSFLATISPVFRQMFESDFKDKNVEVLPVPGKKYEDVLTFLRCSHQGVLVKVEYANVSGVLPLAHEYQVQRLLEECKQCLQNQLFSLPTERFDSNCRDTDTNTMILRCCEVCFLAEKYDLEDLLEICVEKFINVSANWYKNVPMFQKISTKLQNRIFCSRLDVVEKAVR